MPVEQFPTGEFRMVVPQQREAAEDNTAAPEEKHKWIGEIRLLTMLLGALAGAAIASRSYDIKALNNWLIFAIVATLLGAAAGESFGFGLSRWSEVRAVHTVKRLRIWLSVLVILILACGLIAATPYIFGTKSLSETTPTDNLTINGISLSALAIIGGIPIAATLAAVRQVASYPLPGSPGEQLDALLRLRRIASRMLSQLGTLVLLVMAVNAAAIGWGRALQDQNVAIFSGIVASFVVGAMYVPTAATIRRRGAIFIERHYPLATVPLAGLITAADDRNRLEKLLGLDQTAFGELKAGLVVLTPVVVGVGATVIQHLVGQ